MKRKPRTPKQRLAICERHGWICHLTGIKIDPVRDRWEIDHIIPLTEGGSDDDDNLAPALASAHLEKTIERAPIGAACRRKMYKHLGAKKKSGRPMAGTRRSRFKKKVDGTVERRW